MISLLRKMFGVKAIQSNDIKLLSADAFKNAITTDNNVQLLDVRTAMEFKAGHIKNAVNVDFFKQTSFKKNVSKLDNTQPVYLYCRSGKRSSRAARIILAMGFETIYDLKGGYLSWQK